MPRRGSRRSRSRFKSEPSDDDDENALIEAELVNTSDEEGEDRGVVAMDGVTPTAAGAAGTGKKGAGKKGAGKKGAGKKGTEGKKGGAKKGSSSSSSSSKAKAKKDDDDGKKRKSNVETPQYSCDACRTDITMSVRVRCAECDDFDLCLECFSVGVELKDHKANHAYRIVDKLTFELVEEGWTAWEELLLLEAIELFGYGNWYHCADYVGTKDYRQVQAHFEEMYVKMPGQVPQIGTIASEGTSEARFAATHMDGPRGGLVGSLAETSSLAGVVFDSADGDAAEQESKDGGRGSKSHRRKDGSSKRPKTRVNAQATPAEIAGYYEKRRDFDTEWDNLAEDLVVDIAFEEERDQLEHELYLAMLQIYNSKLEERKARKEFVFEHELTNQAQVKLEERRRAKAGEKEVYDSLRVFMRFLTRAEHDQLLQGLVKEKAIRDRIAQLQEFRRAGITSLKDGEDYWNQSHQPPSARASSRRGSSTPSAARTPIFMPLAPVLAPPPRVPRNDGSSLPLPPSALPSQEAPALNVYRYPGVHSLSLAERDLASVLRIEPAILAHAKLRLMESAALSGGALDETTALAELSGLSEDSARAIYHFAKTSGWIGLETTHRVV